MEKFELSFKNIIMLLYYWLCLGFFIGTLILMGPVRWLANYSRAHDWSGSKEKALVFVFIGILIIISFICARLFAAKTAAARGKQVKAVFMAGALSVFIISLWFWLNPKMMIDSRVKETFASFSGTEFVFGPYPEKVRLMELKNENYTAVISLLSPAVVPFEPVLINQETASAKETGIELIHIPMLPWVSSNNQIEGKLKEIIEKGAGKYYVHCYLGKDRVNVFKSILGSVSKDVRLKSLQPESIRTLRDIKEFERGPITILDSNIFFTPYPTDEEFFGYVLNGSVKTLVCLLNPKNKEDLPWIEKERTISGTHRMKFINYPWKTLDKDKKVKVMAKLMNLEKPMAIHAFNSTAPECAEFIETYNKMKSR